VLYPPVDELQKKVDSKFTLVILALRRANQLNNKAPRLIERPRGSKPVTIALEEINHGKIKAKPLKKVSS
jgi:DNA-directed RNA polymerase subunit omega